jgi:hypothetical protein
MPGVRLPVFGIVGFYGLVVELHRVRLASSQFSWHTEGAGYSFNNRILNSRTGGQVELPSGGRESFA